MPLHRLAHRLAHSLSGSFEGHGHGPSPSTHVSANDPDKRICRSEHPDKTDDDQPQRGEPSNDEQDRITIYGPEDDCTYIVEFRTAEGDALAISIPQTEAAVIRHFQAKMPYGLVVS
jgi:hypothetical protein